ncbi:MAG: error-prone DNA polymerase [Thermoanaerobaculia bacterium]
MPDRKPLAIARDLGNIGDPGEAGGTKGGRAYQSPGARKERLTRRVYRKVESRAPLPYAELRAASAFSFLDGASLPEDLVACAAELGLPAVALVDRNGVAGAPRFYKAARAAGLRALVGAEVALAAPGGRSADGCRLTLLVASRDGYRNLCKLITAAARGKPKGAPYATREEIARHAAGLHLLTGGERSPLTRALETQGIDAARAELESWLHFFPGRVHVELERHGRREEERRNQAFVDLAGRLRLPLVATNGVRYARREDKPLHDILTAIREHVPLDGAGSLLAAHRERHLASAAAMARRFSDLPHAVTHAHELAGALDFTLADLGYRFPDYPLPPGETPGSYLREITWNRARSRFRPLSARAQRQIGKELALIEKLELAGYFLIVWDIVEFCRRERILCQGRGSAANSAVCYALGITAIDPVKMELLFERFLSEERGEWPDIDLDLPSGDQREKVIQYVFRRYGDPDGSGGGGGAAMTANVITYRDRMAAREVGKALGYSAEQIDKLSGQLGHFRYDAERGDTKQLDRELAAAGFDPDEPRNRLFADCWQKIQNLPRHLGQHSGGMVIAAGRLDEIVPLEPAAMPGRTIVQWDKDDCADLGIIKVDLLGLGMLNALEEAIPIIREHERIEVDLAHLPADDPAVYAMLRAADTVGVFQVESRAQMASLPRNAPTRFYDLVIQVAIIRPGPITGGMVHPFFERRLGRQKVDYFHPCLEPILARTLGVPIFQEQLLRMAMAVSGFSGGEAEELRRAMGFKRSVERMHSIERRLRDGMNRRGITGPVQDQIVQSITSFALYGFPESHAASFALIAYASAWLKCHHPTAFLISLLNAWPMGFYHPATLVKDARRHGVVSLPIDVNFSDWSCRWEEGGDADPPAPPDPRTGGRPGAAAGACRIGLRYVSGLRRQVGERIAGERRRHGPFADVEELRRRAAVGDEELAKLAEVGALASLGLTRREALWQAALAVRPTGELFEERGSDRATPGRRSSGRRKRPASPLPEMSAYEQTQADFAGTGLTVGRHPVSYVRGSLDREGVVRTADIPRLPSGTRVRMAGVVIVRQRPGTANGTLFLTLEDETGMAQAIVKRELLQQNRATIVGHPGLIVEGVVQQRDGSVSVRAERFWPLERAVETGSHDFH